MTYKLTVSITHRGSPAPKKRPDWIANLNGKHPKTWIETEVIECGQDETLDSLTPEFCVNLHSLILKRVEAKGRHLISATMLLNDRPVAGFTAWSSPSGKWIQSGYDMGSTLAINSLQETLFVKGYY